MDFQLSDGQQHDSGDLAPGTYSVSETLPDGWDLGSRICDDGTSTPDLIDLGPGETVTCTFNNTQQGRIIVKKETDPDGSSQQFTFDPSWSTSTFQLSDGQQHDSGGLPAGNHSVSETVPTGWEHTNAICDDFSTPDSIDLAPGETVTCTFTNSQKGRILVRKETLPDGSPQEFTFTPNWGAAFQLGDGQQHDSGFLGPGVYTATETVPDGWTLTSSPCSDNSTPDNINLGAGEDRHLHVHQHAAGGRPDVQRSDGHHLRQRSGPRRRRAGQRQALHRQAPRHERC